MSSPAAKPQAEIHRSEVHGDDLLRLLQQGWKPLPTRTVISMVMAGLRVRLMRSVVTMVSIVLAIAFLSYTGLSNQLAFNLAQAAVAMEKFTAVDRNELAQAAAALGQVDALAELAQNRQGSLAKDLGMAKTEGQQVEMATLAEALRPARLEAEKTKADLAKLEADGSVSAVDLTAAQAAAKRTGATLAKLEERQQTLEQQVTLGAWLKDPKADSKMSVHLVQALRQKQRDLLEVAAEPENLRSEQLEQLAILLPVLGTKDSPSAALLGKALEQQEASRDAAEFRTMLRRAGINIEATLKGSPMDTWLIAMALLTCMVGIANAMLMSVTERFREIGTMKCLGAQDGLVVKLFLLESAFQGMVGAVFGIALGMLVALLGSLAQFSGFGLRYFPWSHSIGVLLWALLAGVVLSVGGAILPAWQSALMRPVDALRVDE